MYQKSQLEQSTNATAQRKLVLGESQRREVRVRRLISDIDRELLHQADKSQTHRLEKLGRQFRGQKEEQLQGAQVSGREAGAELVHFAKVAQSRPPRNMRVAGGMQSG